MVVALRVSNIRIAQQLSTGYNPDGTPGTITTGIPGPGPTDAQVLDAVTTYLTENPVTVGGNQLPTADPIVLGPGSQGANDVTVSVATNGTKDAWIFAGNGADPTNKTGRQPANLNLLAETNGVVNLGPSVTVGTDLAVSYSTTTGAKIAAPNSITLAAPAVTVTGALNTTGVVRLNNGGDVSLTSTAHALQIGQENDHTNGAVNTIWDGNEMAARVWNTATNAYVAGSFGMTVTNLNIVGSASVTVQGTTTSSLTRKDYVDARVNLPDTAWIVPTYTNGWIDYGAVGFDGAKFRKLSNGQVEIQGMVKGGTMAVSVFVLPVGYRPLFTQVFPQVGNNALARVDVLASGSVVIQFGSTAAWTSLNCTFFAEQ